MRSEDWRRATGRQDVLGDGDGEHAGFSGIRLRNACPAPVK